ncbi:MAG: 50S ribosomal protein L19e [Nanoarchaeota archaeon]
MRLTVQRRLAAEILNCSPKNVRFEGSKLSEVKEAITKVDIRGLIKQGFITKKAESEASRSRARETHSQKVKGKQKGQGSRKGTANARDNQKREWINKVRSQRDLLRDLKGRELITNQTFRDLYAKVKGGFFRNRRHIKLYLGERDLIVRK